MSQSMTSDSANSAAAFFGQTMQMANPVNIYKVTNAAGDAKNVVSTQNFPMQMGSTDPMDYNMALKANLIGDNVNGVIPGVGQAIAGPEDIAYVRRKQEMAQYVEFQDWLFRQADYSSPEKAEYWRKMFPEIIQKKVAEIERVANLQKNMALINLNGPQTREQWLTLWLQEKGLIKVSNQPVHLLPVDATNNTDNYTRGMFSPAVNLIPPTNALAARENPKHIPNLKFNWASPTTYTGEGSQLGNVPAFPTTSNAYIPRAN